MSYRGFEPDNAYCLYIKGAEHPFAEVTGEQLDTLVDLLVEESDTDQDYYIEPATLQYLEEQGADADLLGLLTTQLGTAEGMEIEWKEKEDVG